jgi:predicted transglutaminase-like cysteine proteinase
MRAQNLKYINVSSAFSYSSGISHAIRLGRKHSSIFRDEDCLAMLVFARKTSMLALVMIICCTPSLANAYPTEPEPSIEAGPANPPVSQAVPAGSSNKLEPGALPSLVRREDLGEERTTRSRNLGLGQADLLAKWAEVQSRIQFEQETLAACRLDEGNCPAAALRFLSIVKLGRQQRGRAQLGEINRAVNLSIKPVSDLAQYGIADFWSAPLATLSVAAGDCEDYAILKYIVLREIGIDLDDLQLVIVQDTKRKTVHAVVAVRLNEEWLILDNRTLVLVNTIESQYYPLFVLDHRGVRESGTAAFRR